MRFDQFTTEQLAGDLLPDGTIRSKIASGYNRLLMTTEEGGAQAKEYTAKYAADRVRNASSVWLGSTLGCAECHDHKYDPFKQKDFYSFAAFFADVKETAVGKLATIPLPSEEQKKTQDRLNKDISALEKSIRDELAKIKYEEPDAGSEAKAASARPVKSAGVGKPSELILIDDEHPDCKTVRVNGGNHPFQWTEAQVFSGKRAWKRSDKGVSQDIFDDLKKPFVVAKGDKVFAHVFLDSKDPPKSIMLQYYSASWMHRANWGDADAIPYGTKGTSSKYLAGDLPEAGKWVRLEVDVEKIGITPGTTIGHFAFTQNGGTVFWDKAGLLTSADQSKMNAAIKGDPLEEQSKTSFAAWQKWIARKKYPGIERGLKGILQKKEDKRNKGEAKKVLDYYLENVHAPSRKIFGPLQAKLNPARQKRSALEKQIVRTMVSETTTPRVMRILPRGNWLDESGEVVEPMIPVSLGKLDLTEKRRANRLDLAKWFASRENPLVSRVFVNRLWKLMFGRGLSRSLDDFGMQGTSPSHPELLDWLSVEFIESGWDIKHMLKVIALSHTYRQSSIVNEKLLLIDPYNDLLARQGRFRLDAEMVRDNALQVSGLLVDNVGGSSARPYQPTGYWMHLNFPKRTYVSDTDDGQYRRGVYTYWCRTFLHPSLAAFDASTREECVVERVRSNTPQQALVLLNDPTYVEAARKFAERITKEGGQTVNSRIRFAYRHALAREPRPDEVSLLENLFQKHLKDYQADPEAAEKLLTVGLAKNDSNSGKPELAAWTSISRVVFNLHEFITRQ